MKKIHLTRFAAVATVALMGSTAAWADATGTGWSLTGKTLTLQSNAGTSEILISSGEAATINSAEVNKIVVERNATIAAYSTLILPAEVDLSTTTKNIDAAYVPTSYNVAENTMYFTVAEKILANTPYLVKVTGENLTEFVFTATSGNYAVEAIGEEYSFFLQNSCWEFTGIYKKKSWKTSPGNVYGYDAADGVFVKAGDNVTVYPMRAYLTCHKPQMVKGLGKVAEESLPDVINVRFVDKDGGTLSIGKMNTKTGEIQMQDRYYDLKGRKLNAKPQNKMMYVNKKVIKH